MASHTRLKAVDELFGGSEEKLAIECSPSGDDQLPASVFTSPVIPPSLLRSNLPQYLQSSRTPEGWRYFFESLLEHPDVDDGDVQELGSRTNRELAVGFTPHKKRRVDMGSPVEDAQFARVLHPMVQDMPGVCLWGCVGGWLRPNLLDSGVRRR